MESPKRTIARRPKEADIQDHWAQLIEGMKFSTQEFYERLEVALRDRQIPELASCRVGWKEGGPLSDRREYLRLRRKRLLFDICAMPFGTGFYVSEWIGEQPQRFGLFGFFLTFLLFGSAFFWMIGPRSFFYLAFEYYLRLPRDVMPALVSRVPFVVGPIAIIWFGSRLDDVLINTPLIGYIYERFFRRITFYRFDQSCAYRTAVHAAVCQVIDEISKSQGIAPLSEFARRPTNRDFGFGPQRKTP